MPVLKDRETMGHWASVKIEKNQLHAYQKEWNANSLNGLTGLRVARRDAGERLWVTESTAQDPLLQPNPISHPSNSSNHKRHLILSTMSAPPSISTLARDTHSDPSRWILTWNDNIIETTPVPHTEDSRILLRTPPLTARSVSLLRKVVFTMRSHDQGWSDYPTNHGTFENTWTWFDAAVETKSVEAVQEAHGDIDSLVARMPKPLDSPNIRRHRIQSNRHAVKEAENYRITIDRGQEPLDDLKVGDQIMLIACARYPGWENTIEAAGIEIWEEDDVNH
ncbi:hypothetical protein MMC07_009567 [Pseudocyphellaria aurata]|nr:hypothetical protein [Pseudocyphellaria aurata]